MRELSEIIKEKVVRLFFTGLSYDDIAQQLDIAKGSVTNIISDFRDGQISIPDDMEEYINELRRIAIDLKKHQVSLSQLRSYQKLHNKLQEMNVNNEHIEKWLDLLQVIAASDPSSDKYIDIVGWIADMSAETGKDCKDMLDEYAKKLGYWDYINNEIDSKKSALEKLRDQIKEEKRLNRQETAIKQIKEEDSIRQREIKGALRKII